MSDLTRFRMYLVRHGESEANRALRWQGWGDAALTALGRTQAEATGQKLSTVKFQAAFTSDRKRADETARHIQNKSHHPFELRTEYRLRERFYGGFEGLTSPEVLKRYPLGLHDATSGQSRMEWRPAGGETLEEVLARVGGFLRDCGRLNLDGGSVLSVSHGNVLRLLHAQARGQSEPDLRIPANASVLVLDVFGAGAGVFPALTVIEEPEWEQ